jgi:hypothetical protein
MTKHILKFRILKECGSTVRTLIRSCELIMESDF